MEKGGYSKNGYSDMKCQEYLVLKAQLRGKQHTKQTEVRIASSTKFKKKNQDHFIEAQELVPGF